MNYSVTNDILKQIDTNLEDNIYIGITESNQVLSNIDSTLATMDASLNNIESDIGNIDTSLNNIETDIGIIETNTGKTFTELNEFIQPDITSIKETVADIGITLATFNERNKQMFVSRISWDGNNYLPPDDYTNPDQLTGTWQNTNSTNAYITKYSFCYPHPETYVTPDNLYHSPSSGSTAIGHSDDGTNIQDAAAWIPRNYTQMGFYVNIGVSNHTNEAFHMWQYDFSHAPIEIPPNEYFAHRMAIDWSAFSNNEICGMIEGYTIS